MDSLSRIRLSIAPWPIIYFGNRRQQVVLARLRFGHCKLGASLSRFDATVSPFCACGLRETVSHFLLRCACYDNSRQILFRRVRACYAHDICEEVLLGSPNVRVRRAVLEEISDAVFAFVCATGREI